MWTLYGVCVMAYEDIVHAANLRCRRMRMKYEEVVVLNTVYTDSRIALHMRVVEWRRGHQALTSAQINIRKIKCQFYAIRFFFSSTLLEYDMNCVCCMVVMQFVRTNCEQRGRQWGEIEWNHMICFGGSGCSCVFASIAKSYFRSKHIDPAF